MSLARALTRRIAKREDNDAPGRSKTVRHAAGSIRRDMISLPTELISTTNVQALSAPDISSLNKSIQSSGSSISSHNGSDFSSSFDKSFLTDTDRTDSSSIETSSPATPVTPPMDHSLDFFSAKDISEPLQILDAVPDVPAIPQRAPSHSKKAHVELSRKRSIQRMSPPPSTIPVNPRTSADFFGAADSHPFSKELAKVNEVAEEFGAATALMDEEEQEILGKGFHKFSVEDYINELVGLYGGVYDNTLGPIGNPFI